MRSLAVAGLLLGRLANVSAAQDAVPDFCASYPQTPGAGDWQSTRVFYSGGRLTYAADSAGNRIPDYSYAGYRYGQAAIPAVAEVVRLSPVSGDNTSRIQQALDQVGARSPDANGIRGAVVLNPGTYEIRGTVRVNRSGVVLRGSGDASSASSNTILRATGDTPHQRPVVVLGSGDANWTEVSPRTDITTSFVQVGSFSFQVASASGFAVGDAVVVHHPSSPAWIDAVDGGGVVNDPPWNPGQIDIVQYRRIAGVSGNTITLDVPVYNHLDRSLTQSYLSRVTSNHVTQAGVESLRIDIVTGGGEDENHAWNGVQVVGAHDSWIRRVTALHFGYAGFRLDGAVRFTVEDSRGLDPVAIRTGGRMYNFSLERRSQLVLFSNCEATGGRHGFISNGVSLSSGVVFHRCRATRGGGSEGGHRHWTQGILYDNIVEAEQGQVLLINRGDFGSSHGWGTAHSTIWKYNSELLVQRPPTAQNYGITNAGHFRSSVYFPGPRGHEELRSGRLVPDSLYEAQLCERLGAGGGGLPPIGVGAQAEAEGLDKVGYETNTFEGVTCARATSTSTGHVKGRFSGSSGTYDVTIRYMDENDGQAFLSLKVDGVEVASRALNVDDHAWSLWTVAGVALAEGDEIRVEGARQAGEHARVDYLEAIPAGGGSVKLPIPASAVAASADDGNGPANAVDGDPDTRWSASGDGQWIRFDLGSTRTVDFVRIAWFRGDVRTAFFDVQVSGAPSGPWTTLLRDAESSASTTALETYDLPDGAGRYLRILGHGNSSNPWNSITELEAWARP